MAFPKSFVMVVAVIISVALLVSFFIELQTSSKPTAKLVVSDTKLNVVYYGISVYLLIDAKVSNIGKSNATNIVLFIKTYYENGTESFNSAMTLSQNLTTTTYLCLKAQVRNVNVNAGKSYFAQSGDYVLFNDTENPWTPYGFPVLSPQLYESRTNFFAHYKITLSYQVS